MSDTVIVALIGVVSSGLTSLLAIIPTIIANRKSTQKSLEETDLQIKEALQKTDDRIDDLTEKFEVYKAQDDSRWAESVRVRILRFSDELADESKPFPSKGHFEQALKDCGDYRSFIDTHDGFHNGFAEMNMEIIQDTYRKCMQMKLFGAKK